LGRWLHAWNAGKYRPHPDERLDWFQATPLQKKTAGIAAGAYRADIAFLRISTHKLSFFLILQKGNTRPIFLRRSPQPHRDRIEQKILTNVGDVSGL
jgi:hypothetical protein